MRKRPLYSLEMIFVQPDEGDQPSQRGGRFSKGQLRIGEQLVGEGAG